MLHEQALVLLGPVIEAVTETWHLSHGPSSREQVLDGSKTDVMEAEEVVSGPSQLLDFSVRHQDRALVLVT